MRGYAAGMKEHEIVAAVRQSAGIDSPEQAKQATTATLEVLGARLAGGEPGNVADQLPPGLAVVLPTQGPGERFGVEEFYRRVAEKEACPQPRARQHARAVLAALRVQLTGHEYDHLAAQLPGDYADLLGTEPVQHH